MKKYLYATISILFFIAGAAGAFTGIKLMASVIILAFALIYLLIDYEKATYVLALYLILDYAFRNLIAVPLLAGIWDELLFMAFVLLWVWKWLVHRKQQAYHWTPLDFPLVLFFGIGIFLLFVKSPDMKIAIEGLRAVIQYMFWYFVAVQLLKSSRGAKHILYLLVFIGTMLGLHGVYQFIVGAEMPSTWIDTVEKGIRTRAYSIIGSPNILGSLMVLLIPPCIGFACSEKKKGKKLFFAASALIMLLCLLVTYSRGAWIGFAAAVLILILMIDKRLLLPAVIGGIAVLVLVPSVGGRIAYMLSPQYLQSSLSAGRAIRWLTGLNMVKENPIFGVGLGRFGGAVAMNNNIPGAFYMDNYFLKTAVEMGLVGLTAFCALMYSTLSWCLRALQNMKNKELLRPCQGALAGMAGVVTHNLVENVFEVPMMVTYFWLLAAVIIFLGFIYYKADHYNPDDYEADDHKADNYKPDDY